jgi:hypothetical protein
MGAIYILGFFVENENQSAKQFDIEKWVSLWLGK